MNYFQKLYEACLLVNNNLCGKSVLLLESSITFDERFKVTSVQFLFPGFDLLICELDSFTFQLLS